jgi:hypothetical protein
MRRLIVLLALAGGCAHTTAPPTTTAPQPAQSDTQRRLDALTALLEQADFDGALRDTDAWLATKPGAGTEELIYNCRTWIRWATGDKAGALAENEKLRALAERDPKHERLRNYWWDRAYLLADSGKRDAAEAARAEFFRVADKPDDRDSKLVLEAWLATMRGDGAAARKAASAVDPAKDDDLQDWYVLMRAMEAAGDRAAAEQLRAKIKQGPRYPMKPLIVRELEKDAAK